ncbi:MAG: glycosyltransferase [Patescibacteria group bacterium]|jgi:GT2 family glycosyltransferase
MKFSLIIPTYNRQKELAVCFYSILQQDFLPTEIVVIDDAELNGEFLDYWKKKFVSFSVSFVYYRKDMTKEVGGSSSSRNVGLGLAKEKICFILDDDLVLENYFFSKTMAMWKDDDKLLGVGGVITNNRRKGFLEKIYNKIFCLDTELSWDINKVGFQSWDDSIGDCQKAFYVHGGACSYNKEIIKKLGGFTVFGGGREALEDVDFCWRAKQIGYYFLIEPKARVFHAHSPSGRESEEIAGYKESANRKAIWAKLGDKGVFERVSFYWANIGWILRQILRGKFKKSWGMIRGLFYHQ